MCNFAIGSNIEDLSASVIETELRKQGIIPDVIGEKDSPNHVIKIAYTYPHSNLEDARVVSFGNTLKPSHLYEYPKQIEWPGYSEKYYSLMMVDVDAPSRLNPSQREKIHWLIVNIPGPKVVYDKDILFNYIGPRPTQGTGFHRYVFLVYEQPRGKMTFIEPRLYTNLLDVRRDNFSCSNFAKNYNFSRPVAVNFFFSRIL
nr:PREDICTED: protein D2-like isoform X2 [Bemisia tabaci]